MHRPEEWLAAGVALGTTTIAALVALTLSTTLEIQSPYLVFLLAVVVADMSAGAIAGISASVLSVLFTWFFFMSPERSFAFPSLSDGLTVALLLIVRAAPRPPMAWPASTHRRSDRREFQFTVEATQVRTQQFALVVKSQ